MQRGDMARWHCNCELKALCKGPVVFHNHRSVRGTARAGECGFTIVELVIVLTVTLIIAVVAVSSLKQGLYTEYKASQTARELVIALQGARMRALQNERVVRVSGVTAISTAGAYQIAFPLDTSGTCEHGFSVGDYAAFSGLTYPIGMNGGAYYVMSVGTSSIQVLYPGEADSTTESLGEPLAKNISKAASLKVRPRSGNSDLHPDYGELVYDPKRMGIWIDGDYAPSPGGSAPGEFSVYFNSRGLTNYPDGYRITVAPRYWYYSSFLDKYVDDFLFEAGSSPYKVLGVGKITVSPFGIVRPGQ